MEKNGFRNEMSVDTLEKENSTLRRKLWFYRIFAGVLIAVILLLQYCSSKQKEQYESEITAITLRFNSRIDSLNNLLKCKTAAFDSLKKENDSLKKENKSLKNTNSLQKKENEGLRKEKEASLLKTKELENRKVVVEATDGVDKDNNPGKIIKGKIVPANIIGDSTMFIKNCPEIPNDSIGVLLTEQSPNQAPISLVNARMALRGFFSNDPPSLHWSRSFTEYIPNIYRKKSENAFWGGVGSGIIALALYETTEQLGHPKFYDDRDNSSAQKKHDWIVGLRIGSGVFGTLSAIEFGRSWHFHKMEGRFIIGPKKIGLNVGLNPPNEKK
jgi:hypothetical protein